jgi:hypothetical protein
VFLYPALGIKKGNSIVPTECYVTWEGKYTIDDEKLISKYYLRSDKELEVFEAKRLFGNELYHEFFKINDTLGAYVFDFKQFKNDISSFAAGKYSKLSPDLKKKIIKFYAQSVKYTHIHSYLYPYKYMNLYSDLLGVPKTILEEVGELWDPPDFTKENLIADVKNLEISKLTV